MPGKTKLNAALLVVLAVFAALLLLQVFWLTVGSTIIIPVEAYSLAGMQRFSAGAIVQTGGTGAQLELHQPDALVRVGMGLYTLAPYLPLLAMWGAVWAVVNRRQASAAADSALRSYLSGGLLATGSALALFVLLRSGGAYIAGLSGIAAVPGAAAELTPTTGINLGMTVLNCCVALGLLAVGVLLRRQARLAA